jgi:hypothetical protein
MHPNATVKHQAGEKYDPTCKGGGKSGGGR